VCNNVSKVGDAAGRPEYVVAVVQDISERMEAEERRRLLLAELSHRVKNTLATVLSIVVRTSKSSRSREEFHEDLEARLKSLAETHTLLSREDWAGAELNAIAAGELRPLLAEKAGRVRIEGPRVYLKPHAALSLHLVLHELTTNAAKYGALSAVGGRVDLTWVVEPPGTARALVLRWRESSGPKVAPPERRGFGTTMIVDAVEYELDAKTSLEYREDGFCYDLVIPFTVDVGRVLDGLRGERAGRR
jgi:two-component sensor histidine kinase